MEINVKMNVKAEEMYSVLMSSLKYDIKQAIGVEMAIDQIKEGFSYSKILKNKIGHAANSKALITKLEENKRYEAQFTTSRGVNIVTYDIKEISENEIKVIYSEDYLAINKNKDLNFKLMNFFFKRGIKKKAYSLLQMMEEHITLEKEKNII